MRLIAVCFLPVRSTNRVADNPYNLSQSPYLCVLKILTQNFLYQLVLNWLEHLFDSDKIYSADIGIDGETKYLAQKL